MACDIIDWVNALFKPDDIIELRALPSKKRGWIHARDIHKHVDKIKKRNETDDIYCGIHPRKKHGFGRNVDVCNIRKVFVDIDNAGIGEARTRIASSRLPEPSIIVDSGHGVHAYWLLDGEIENIRLYSDIQSQIAQAVGSDPSVKDAARIMRVAGTVNYKPPRSSCRILDRGGEIYSLADIFDVLPDDAQKSLPEPRNEPILARARAYVASIPAATQGERGDDQTYRVACKLVREFALPHDAAYTLLAEYNQRCSPPWTDAELRAKVDNASKYGRSAIGSKLVTDIKEIPHVGAVGTLAANSGRNATGIFGDLLDHVEHNRPIINTVKCGWGLIDDTVGGLIRGEYIGMVGVPGAGKTTQADHVVVEALIRDPSLKAKIFAIETSPMVRLARVAAGRTCWPTSNGGLQDLVSVKHLLMGGLGEHEAINVTRKIVELRDQIGDRLQIDDLTCSAADIALSIRTDTPDIVLIDHLGLVTSDNMGDGEISQFDAALGSIAMAIRQSDSAAIIINETNKAALSSDRINMASSRGSARFASLAAMFIGLHRAKPAPDSDRKNPIITAEISKSRFGSNDKQQVAEFWGGHAYFAWGPVQEAADEGRERAD